MQETDKTEQETSDEGQVAGGAKKAPEMNPAEKARANPKSLRAAINAKCWDCTCYQKAEVTKCEMYDCSLWPLRPWQRK